MGLALAKVQKRTFGQKNCLTCIRDVRVRLGSETAPMKVGKVENSILC